MARQAVVEAVEGRLEANWTACPVIGENTTGQAPIDGSPFLVVQYPFAESRQLTHGAPGQNYWRDEGAFRIVIHVERGSAVNLGRQWADELGNLFRGKDLGAVQTWAPSAPVTDDRNEDGNYYVLSIVCGYWHDYVG